MTVLEVHMPRGGLAILGVPTPSIYAWTQIRLALERLGRVSTQTLVVHVQEALELCFFFCVIWIDGAWCMTVWVQSE